MEGLGKLKEGVNGLADKVADTSGAGLDQVGLLGGKVFDVGDGLVDAAGSLTDIVVGPVAGTRAERAAADIIDGGASDMEEAYDSWEKMGQECVINAYDWHMCRKKDGEKKVACKMSSIADLDTFCQEVRLLKQLQPRCENFINIENVFRMDKRLCVMTAEHSDCNMQSLVDERAAAGDTDLNAVDDIASNAAFCVLAAAQQLNGVGYAHRDLKPKCFVAESVVPAHLRVWKLSDISFAKQWGSCAKAVDSAQSRVSYFRSTSDPCSVGLIIYSVLCGRLPFARLEATGDFQEYPDPEFECPAWEQSSPGAKKVVIGLLSKEPSARLSITRALRHVWVSKSRGNLPEREPNDYTGMGYTPDGCALLDLVHEAYTSKTKWDTETVTRADITDLLSSILLRDEGTSRHPLVRLVVRATLPGYSMRAKAIIDRSLDTIQGSRSNHVGFYDFLRLIGVSPWKRYLPNEAAAGEDLRRHGRQSQSFVSKTERLLACLSKRIMAGPQLAMYRKRVEERAAAAAEKAEKKAAAGKGLVGSLSLFGDKSE